MHFNGKIKYNLIDLHWHLVVLLLLSCHSSTEDASEQSVGKKESQKSKVHLFAPGVISTSLNELNVTFSPDGSFLLYTIANHSSSHTFYTIFISQKRNGGWSSPQIAPFSGQYSDADPFFSPDGKGLYFISLRPLPGTGSPKKDFDIWYVGYDNDRWFTPRHLGHSVNSDKDELYPSVTWNGNLYFSSETENNGYDIMMSPLTSTGYQKPSAVNGALNTKAVEYDAYVTPDESSMVFTAIGRKDGMGSGDLYISYNHNGAWTEGKNLGVDVNSPFMDQCPSFSPDGKTFFFTSFRDNNAFVLQKQLTTAAYLQLLQSPLNGAGNLFWIQAKYILL